MKRIEAVRCLLNKALENGCKDDDVLSISRYLDDLILEKMKAQYEKYIIKGRNRRK